jgi:hypothetical protein
LQGCAGGRGRSGDMGGELADGREGDVQRGSLRDQAPDRGRGRPRQLPDERVLEEALLKGEDGRLDTVAPDLVELRVQISSADVSLEELLQFPDRRPVTCKGPPLRAFCGWR